MLGSVSSFSFGLALTFRWWRRTWAFGLALALTFSTWGLLTLDLRPIVLVIAFVATRALTIVLQELVAISFASRYNCIALLCIAETSISFRIFSLKLTSLCLLRPRFNMS